MSVENILVLDYSLLLFVCVCCACDGRVRVMDSLATATPRPYVVFLRFRRLRLKATVILRSHFKTRTAERMNCLCL